jgi:DNA-binding transcriptional LysR family regulator
VLGTPDLYAAFMLPSILRIFRKAFPRVQLELNCSLSTPLVGCVKRGEVDIALVTRMNDFTGGQVVRQEQLIWMTGEQSTAHNEKPIPLALLPPGNIYRDHAIETAGSLKTPMAHCLRQSERRWFAGRRFRRHGGHRPRPLRTGTQHARDRRERGAAAAAEGRSSAV